MRNRAALVILLLAMALAACGSPEPPPTPSQDGVGTVEAETTGTFLLPSERGVEAIPNAIPPDIQVTENPEVREPLNREMLESALPCPPLAREAGVDGGRKVTAFIQVNPDGTVQEAILDRNDVLGFSEAATDVFRQLRYEPTGDTVLEIAVLWFDCEAE